MEDPFREEVREHKLRRNRGPRDGQEVGGLVVRAGRLLEAVEELLLRERHRLREHRRFVDRIAPLVLEA